MTIETVDTALRHLAHDCTTNAQPLPQLRAARLTGDQLDLYLAEPAQLPEPWRGTTDASVWTLLADHAPSDVNLTDVPAPYPALVTVGHDTNGGHIFVDLEFVGTLGLSGTEQTAHEAMTAIAIELATSHWADDLQVTLVGLSPELEDALQSGRIRYLPSIGRVLEELQLRADRDRDALRSVGDLQHARTAGEAPDAWTPEIVLLGGPLTDRQRNQLDQILDDLPRVAIATVTTTAADMGEWQLDIDPDDPDSAMLRPVGLAIQPQRVDADAYAGILDLIAIAGEDNPATDTEQSAPATEDTPAPAADDPDAAEVEPANTQQAPGGSDESSTDREASQDKPASDEQPIAAEAEPVAATPEAAPEESEAEGVEAAEIDVTGDEQLADTEREPAAATPEAAPEESEAEGVEAVEPDMAGHEQLADTEPEPVAAVAMREPLIRILGRVDVDNVAGTVEPSKRKRLLEYAAYLALNPAASHT